MPSASTSAPPLPFPPPPRDTTNRKIQFCFCYTIYYNTYHVRPYPRRRADTTEIDTRLSVSCAVEQAVARHAGIGIDYTLQLHPPPATAWLLGVPTQPPRLKTAASAASAQNQNNRITSSPLRGHVYRNRYSMIHFCAVARPTATYTYRLHPRPRLVLGLPAHPHHAVANTPVASRCASASASSTRHEQNRGMYRLLNNLII